MTGAEEVEDLARLTRSVSVPVRRLDAWLAGFRQRHAEVSVRALEPGPDGAARWLLTGQDGERGLVEVPVWLSAGVDEDRLGGTSPGQPIAPSDGPVIVVLMVRRAGYAVAVLRGDQKVQAKVGKRHIHGRTAAGGWSQQRYARRRANQADEIVAATAAAFESVVGSHPGELAVLVTGGERSLLASARELVDLSRTDRALSARLAGLPEVHLGIGTPTSDVLAGVPDRVLAVRVYLDDIPEPGGRDG